MYSKATLTALLTVLIFLVPFGFVKAAEEPLNNVILFDPMALVCQTLSEIGFPCLGSNRSAVIKNKSLVRSDANPNIYQIINGKKHLIPNGEIFSDYGFDKNKVATVSQEQLDKYPRVTLVRSAEDRKKIYYLTETGLKRFIPDGSILESYGGKKRDIVKVSPKELDFYSDNKYVYLLNPYSPDIFKFEGNKKYYLTPMAAARLAIRNYQVAPVNKFEFDYYKYGRPVTE